MFEDGSRGGRGPRSQCGVDTVQQILTAVRNRYTPGTCPMTEWQARDRTALGNTAPTDMLKTFFSGTALALELMIKTLGPAPSRRHDGTARKLSVLNAVRHPLRLEHLLCNRIELGRHRLSRTSSGSQPPRPHSSCTTWAPSCRQQLPGSTHP